MLRQTVRLPGREYDIWLGEGILAEAGRLLGGLLRPGDRAAVVSDETVWGLYGDALTSELARAGCKTGAVVLPPGEPSKSMGSLGRVLGAFAEMGLGRGGFAVALGGGVIGDLCGFAAAVYMRGIRYIQVPTTLLAQVDSSVGGKTAVNLPQGKNLAGAFHQPSAVLADTAALKTLPPREWSGGMAEIVKYAAIRSRDLFARLEHKPEREELAGIIAECCAIKSGVVARDELDRGERMLLNFGHTFGHAVEKHYDFTRYSHGEAVAVGMVMAAEVGGELGRTPPGAARELRRVLSAHGLPVHCPAGTEELLPLMAADKKGGNGGVNLILLREIGDAFAEKIGFERLGQIMRRVEAKWKTES